MKTNVSLTKRWSPFLANLILQFIEINKDEIGEKYCFILMSFTKGESIEKIAAERNVTPTRIRQLLDVGSKLLERKMAKASLSLTRSLQIQCESLERENASLKWTLRIHDLQANTPIEKLNLSARAYNALKKMNITSIEQLCRIEEGEMWKVRNAGEKTIKEIEAALSNLGLSFGDSTLQ